MNWIAERYLHSSVGCPCLDKSLFQHFPSFSIDPVELIQFVPQVFVDLGFVLNMKEGNDLAAAFNESLDIVKRPVGCIRKVCRVRG